ncbi:phage portal protein [Mesorhizobium sp. SP-1A]|uniref:phage portal protein n=1 Tax=Mesorhizobium sp. SP-1A TaxID=3077840 RepID=UPI0028F71648|nr:phage portal protein [Mesorhizobium sp. SP-1A]
MGFIDRLFSPSVERPRARPAAAVPIVPLATASMPENHFTVDGERLADLMRAVSMTESGANVTVAKALKNTTVFRCVSLVSYTIGMLPLHLFETGDEQLKAESHPLYKLLAMQPNDWQSPFDFKALLQLRALVDGDAFALIVRSMGRPIRLVPLPYGMVTIKQNDDWTVEYHYQPPKGPKRVFKADEILHLRGLSTDGLRGMSLVKQAAEAIGLALQTEKAAARLFRNGMLVGGALKHKNKLSPEAYERLKTSMAERESADNAHKWLILEEEMDATPFAQTGRDSQHLETRKHQIEEIGRVFGVPRPLLMVDDTSWGSGIDVLGQLFVRYGLAPWFTAWEQAIARSVLVDEEKGRFYAKFNEGALLRGSMKDQAEFFAKALGSGGHQPWMAVDEVRALQELGKAKPGQLPARPGQQENRP